MAWHDPSLPTMYPLQPPLLNRPGMGVRLITYYRKKDGGDTGHLELKKSELPIQCLLLLPCLQEVLLCSRVPAEVFCFAPVVFTPLRLPLPCPTVSPRWRVGAVQPLGDDDETPFLGKHSAATASVVSVWRRNTLPG